MKTVYTDIRECSGCSACLGICKQCAISMKFDENGFLYPIIDSDKCVDCGLCRQQCPSINEEVNSLIRIGCERPKTYAAYAKENVTDSTSGGIATVISQKVIDNGGIVYGAKWRDNCRTAAFNRAMTIEEVHEFRTSKYVQCDKSEAYKLVRADLNKGFMVLFIGLPCEVAGLRSYLMTDYEKLLTISLICHAVASSKYLDVVLTNIEQKMKSKVCALNMRYKQGGRTSYSVKIRFDDKREIVLSENEFYFHPAFLENYITRPSCGNCKFKGFPQFSDITLGDYWGLSESHKGYNKAGVSAVLINTPRGGSLFQSVYDNIFSYEGDLDSLLGVNKRLVFSIPYPKSSKLKKLENRYGTLGALNKIALEKLWKVRITSIKSFVRYLLRNLLNMVN